MVPNDVFDPRGAEAYLGEVEHPEARKTRWAPHINGRSRRSLQPQGHKKPPGDEPGGELEAGGAVQLSRQDQNERILKVGRLRLADLKVGSRWKASPDPSHCSCWNPIINSGTTRCPVKIC